MIHAFKSRVFNLTEDITIMFFLYLMPSLPIMQQILTKMKDKLCVISVQTNFYVHGRWRSKWTKSPCRGNFVEGNICSSQAGFFVILSKEMSLFCNIEEKEKKNSINIIIVIIIVTNILAYWIRHSQFNTLVIKWIIAFTSNL